MPLPIGARLSHYAVVSALGAGGMGEVYRARDTRLERDVALKVLPSHLCNDAEARARFEREAKAVAALSHPAILSIHDFFSEGGTSCAVTELLEGETLRLALRNGPLPIRAAIGYAREIAQGLAAAHEKGFAHRDIKPENIFITDDGRLKILDFGLAKSVVRPGNRSDSPATLTIDGVISGTVGYMAPEQVRGEVADPRSDIFALGATLYEMLTGTKAFKADSDVETLNAILKADAPPMLPARPNVPPGLERLVRRCLEKRPQDRFQSARDVAFALETFSDAKEAVPAVAGHPKGDRPSVAVLAFADMSAAKDQDYFCEGMAEEIINTLSRSGGLKVAARTSAFQFKGRTADIGKIGEALGVRTVLEGSVRTAGNRLRVTTQLLSVEDGTPLWSEKYDRVLEDVFAIQDEIAASIAQALRAQLSVRPQSPAAADIEAYRLYLRGRQQRMQGQLASAVNLFEQSAARDPNFALAHAGLVDAWAVKGLYGYAPPAEARAKAKEALHRALTLDAGLGPAHYGRGLYAMLCEFDWPEAERALAHARAIDPGNVQAWAWSAILAVLLKRHEDAWSLIRHAREVDPLSGYVAGLSSFVLLEWGRPEEAMAEARRGLEYDSASTIAKQHFAHAAFIAGHSDKASATFEALVAATGRAPVFLGFLAIADGKTGQRDEAEQILAELQRRSSKEYVAPLAFAMVLSGLGRFDEAIRWVETAFASHDAGVTHVGFRMMGDLGAHPRVRELLRGIGLPA